MFQIFRRPDIKGVLENVGVKDAHSCLVWSFGNDYETALLSTLNDRWNDKHKDLFIVHGSDNFITGIERIGREYIKQVEGK